MSISPPRLSTGTMARISNGPCRLTGADGIETSNFLVFVFVFVFSSPAIADRRMKEFDEKKLSSTLKTSNSSPELVPQLECLGVTRPPIINVSMRR